MSVHHPSCLAGLVLLSALLAPAAALAEDAPEAEIAPATTPAPMSDSAPSAAERFAAANRMYLRGEYEAAARAYAELHTERRIEDPVLYHNLGNAYFRSGAYGSAILYYQRALRLEPLGEVAEALGRNLDAARRTLQARNRQGSDNTRYVYAEAGGLLHKATHLLGRTPLALLFAAFWFGLMGLLIARRLRPAARSFGRAAVPVGLAALLLGLALWGQIYTDASHRIGVVVVDGVALRDGRSLESKGARDVPEGAEVRILEERESWTRIELPSGLRGWVEAPTVKQI